MQEHLDPMSDEQLAKELAVQIVLCRMEKYYCAWCEEYDIIPGGIYRHRHYSWVKKCACEREMSRES